MPPAAASTPPAGAPAALRRGFSLVELIVALAVIAVLGAFVVPRFTSTTDPGSDADAQTSLSTALDGEVVSLQTTGALTTDATALSGLHPEDTYLAAGTASDASTHVSVAVSGQVLALAALGAGGDCWWVRRDFAAAGTATVLYARSAATPTGPACTGTEALTLTPDTNDPSRGSSFTSPLLH